MIAVKYMKFEKKWLRLEQYNRSLLGPNTSSIQQCSTRKTGGTKKVRFRTNNYCGNINANKLY